MKKILILLAALCSISHGQIIVEGGGGGAGGDVVGPASVTADTVAIFSGTTGKLLKDTSTNVRIAFDDTGVTTAAHFSIFNQDAGITHFDLDGAGQVSIGTLTKTATRLNLKGTGTTTAKVFTTENSSNVNTFYVQDNGWAASKSATNSEQATFTAIDSSGTYKLQLFQLGTAPAFTSGVYQATHAGIYTVANQVYMADNSGYFAWSTNTSYAERMRLSNAGGLSVGATTDPGAGGILANTIVRTPNLRLSAPTIPASAGATGVTGDIAWDADFIYVCTATNTWKRTAIATWP